MPGEPIVGALLMSPAHQPNVQGRTPGGRWRLLRGAKALAGAAGILALHLCGAPRCGRCGRAAVADNGEQAAPGLPIVLIDYHCPGCHRILDRRCLGTWD